MTGTPEKRTVSNMARRASARRAMSLLELVGVVAIVGLLGLMAATRYGHGAIGKEGAQGFARRLVADCMQARRRAISTGENHYLQFTLSGGDATQYALYRRLSGSNVRVDDIHNVPSDFTVSPEGTPEIEFAFTGEALATYQIVIEETANSGGWRVNVMQITGKAFMQEL